MFRYFIYFLLLISLPCLSQGQQISLSPFPETINSPYSEELGKWNVDGKSMIFTRLADTTAFLYTAKFDNTGKLSSVEKFPFATAYKGGGHAISPDGKKIVFTLCHAAYSFGGCDLFQSQWIDSAWTSPANLGPVFNGSGWEGQPAFGADGQSIFFASDRNGGFGGNDIWFVRVLPNGTWSKPINAGAGINTVNNEGSPYIFFDGRTIYFMRDGKEGLGGYDLYYAQQGIDGNWKTAVNMGSPINSADNEGGLALRPDGKTALITKSTPDKKNDLFEFVLPEKFRSPAVQAIQANVVDKENNKPLHAQVLFFEINGRDTIRNSQATDEAGNITITAERNKEYGLIATSPGYIMNSAHLQATSEPSRNIHLAMISLNASNSTPVSLQNIFFESGSATLANDSKPELNILLQMLNHNPDMEIEIQGHTDDVGTEATNQLLSEQRAKSVYQYLSDYGIATNRLSYKGYGESQPITSNATPEGRQQNRRTEFRIIKH